MNIDDLTEQFTECVQAEVERQISTARATLAKLKGEVAEASKALSDLGDQRTLAESQLEAVKADLRRHSDLVFVDAELDEARKALAALKSETAKTTTASKS